MFDFVDMARSWPPPPLRFTSYHVAYEVTEVFTSREPGDARGTKSVAQRRGRSSTISQADSSEPCLAGLPRSEPEGVGGNPVLEEAGVSKDWKEDVAGSG